MADFSLDQQKALAMASARARAAAAGPALGPKDVPGDAPPAAPAPEPSAWERVKAIPETAVAAGQGALAGLAGRAAALVPGVDPQTGVKVQNAMAPTPSPGAQANLDVLGKLTEPLEGLGPMAMPGGAATRLAKPAAKALGATPEAGMLKAIPGKLADVVTPTPSKEIAALAKKAEGMGIELRPDMLQNNRIIRSLGEALENVPLSGSKAENRQIAFNSALTKIIGGDGKAKRLTPDVYDKAMTASGEKIGQISKETPITVSPELQQKFQARVLESSKFETADVAKIVKNYVVELGAKAGADGVIPGEAFRKINSKIGAQIRSTSNGDLKNALRELQEDMHDALEKNISSPERLAELKDARFKYAMGKIIEPLVAKAKGGDISPQALMGAVTSDGAKKTMMARGRGGEIGDLARIGQAFLKEPGSSGTAERNLAYGLLGDAAAMARDAMVYPVANAYNRLGPKITKRAVNMREIDPAADQPWNLGQP